MSHPRIGPAPPRAEWLSAGANPRRAPEPAADRPAPGFGLRNDVVIEPLQRPLGARAARAFNWLLALTAAAAALAVIGVLISLIYRAAFST